MIRFRTHLKSVDLSGNISEFQDPASMTLCPMSVVQAQKAFFTPIHSSTVTRTRDSKATELKINIATGSPRGCLGFFKLLMFYTVLNRIPPDSESSSRGRRPATIPN